MTTTPLTPTASTPTRAVRGPVRARERALAPDLTRGAMLLFIAVANTGNVAFAGQPGLAETPHGVERVINFLRLVAVDARAYPVFAVMFGYGLVQLFRRQSEAPGATPASARRILVRRNAWLVGFGLAHATLLYFGDFLGAYGLVGLACAYLLIRRSPRFHRIALWLWGLQTVWLGVVALGALASVHSGRAPFVNAPDPSLAASSFGSALIDRLHEWPIHTLQVLPIIVVVWLGIWAAQHRILEHPERHRRLLTVTAVVGLGITFLGALPYALVGAGWLHVDGTTMDRFAFLHDLSGEYGGPGYVALLALVAARLSRRDAHGSATRAVVALGQRSLSGYLTQSVVWTVLLMPWTLHLGSHGSTVTVALVVAILTWVGSCAAAYALAERGRTGPAEKVLRSLVYR